MTQKFANDLVFGLNLFTLPIVSTPVPSWSLIWHFLKTFERPCPNVSHTCRDWRHIFSLWYFITLKLCKRDGLLWLVDSVASSTLIATERGSFVIRAYVGYAFSSEMTTHDTWTMKRRFLPDWLVTKLLRYGFWINELFTDTLPQYRVSEAKKYWSKKIPNHKLIYLSPVDSLFRRIHIKSFTK